MKVQMREVTGWDDLKAAGDYMMADRSVTDVRRATHGARFPIIVCPRCLRPGVCSNHTLVSERPLTIRASYLCGRAKAGGTCGFHGWVTGGWIEEG